VTTYPTIEEAVAAVMAEARETGEAVNIVLHEKRCTSRDGAETGCTCNPQVVEYDPNARPA